MTDFKAIETFMWVVTLGSFRGAAQKLNTTQPAISQRIAQLEREVGVRLLQRDRRMVLPTPSGRQMMVYAEKLIGLRSEMLAVVGDRTAMHGVLRLGVAETIVHTWLSQLVKSVNHAYPNLSLEIEVDVSESYINRVEPDQPVTATLDSYPDWHIPAHVIAIIPSADRQKATVKVRVGFEKLDPRILPDMGVKVAFQSGDKPDASAAPGVMIPRAAVHRRDGRDVVWVVHHARVTPRAIALGAPNGDEIAVASGLAAGEKVVVGDTADLTDGAPITETTP